MASQEGVKVVLLRGFQDFEAAAIAAKVLEPVFGPGAPVLAAVDWDQVGDVYNIVAMARLGYEGPKELAVHPNDEGAITRYALGSMSNAIANNIHLPKPR
jgi:hypothetical protein